ncbi:MAG TPA: FliH/SctL family protein [Casimicrobiaceae bacterium]|nr:FliH/SctL family protein [Casimicrobiaceae bacterium]
MTTPSSDAVPTPERPATSKLSAWQRWELGSLETPAATNANEAASERAQAYHAAQREGHAAGYAEGIAQAAGERARLTELIGRLSVCAADHEQRLCDEVLDLALVLARQLVGEALSVRREFVLPVVSAALKQLPQSTQRVELHVNPADLALVETHVRDSETGARCRISGDSTIAPGGCKVETEQCEIDMTSPTRWRRLLAILGRSDDWIEPV